MWEVLLTSNAEKDKKLIKRAGLENKARSLLKLLSENPYQNPPSYEKLIGDLKGFYSRRINIQRRLIYQIDDEKKIVIVYAMWSHYE